MPVKYGSCLYMYILSLSPPPPTPPKEKKLSSEADIAVYTEIAKTFDPPLNL